MPRPLDGEELRELRESDLRPELAERIAEISAYLEALDQVALHAPLRDPDA